MPEEKDLGASLVSEGRLLQKMFQYQVVGPIVYLRSIFHSVMSPYVPIQRVTMCLVLQEQKNGLD